MSKLLEFFTLAFPKAGITVGGIGITFSLLLFFLFCVKNPLKILISVWNWGKDVFIVYLVFVFVSLIIVVKNFYDNTLIPFNIAQLFIILISPLAFVIPQTFSPEKQFGLVNLSALIVSGYAILQKIFGITSIALAGLTYTLGASLTDKPIGYLKGAESASNKMPSTYQNGNGMGIFLALTLLLLMIWPTKTKRQVRLKITSIVFSIVALLLSGSRSILFPLLLILIILSFYHGVPKKHFVKKNSLIIVTFVFVLIVFVLIPYLIENSQAILDSKLYDRYVLQTLQNPSSDRSETWQEMLIYIGDLKGPQALQFFFFGTPNGQFNGEGIIALLVEYGPIITFSLFYLLFRFWGRVWHREKLHLFSFAMLAVIFAFCIDQSFYYPPSLMNYFLISEVATECLEKQNYKRFQGDE